MNKEFRAYDKETCQMFYPMKDSCLLSVDYCELKFLVADITNGSAEEDDYIVMQWTGLYDRNGVKIFEGDIFDMGVIIFSRGCFNGCYISGSTNVRGWDYSDDWEDGLYSHARDNEIIGNIYESPELLKESE